MLIANDRRQLNNHQISFDKMETTNKDLAPGEASERTKEEEKCHHRSVLRWHTRQTSNKPERIEKKERERERRKNSAS